MNFNYGTKILAGDEGGITEEFRELTKKFSLKFVASQKQELHQNIGERHG
jgi:hypothetical protein